MPVARRRAPRSEPPRRALNRDAIADAAMAILDAEGLDAISMRRVAQELGTGPASLYAHVEHKDDLLAILVDRAIGEVALPDPSRASWQENVRLFVGLAREAFTRHADLARASMGVIPTGPNALTASEWLLGVLRGAGIPDQVAAYAIDLLSLYATAIAFEEGLFVTSMTTIDPDAYIAEVAERYRSLPADRFPNIVATTDELLRGEGDERFEFGLDIMIAGLERHAKA